MIFLNPVALKKFRLNLTLIAQAMELPVGFEKPMQFCSTSSIDSGKKNIFRKRIEVLKSFAKDETAVFLN